MFVAKKQEDELIKFAAALPSTDVHVQCIIDLNPGEKYSEDSVTVSAFSDSVELSDIEDVIALRKFLNFFIEEHQKAQERIKLKKVIEKINDHAKCTCSACKGENPEPLYQQNSNGIKTRIG